jgi:hypothetical protein
MTRKPKLLQPPPAEGYDPDSSCWRLFATVHQCLTETKTVGDSTYVMLHLLAAWSAGELTLKREQTLNVGKELEPPDEVAEWTPFCFPAVIDATWREWLTTRGPLRNAESGWVYYAYGPEIERLFEAPCPECEEPAPEPEFEFIESIAKRGRKALTPWKKHVAREWCRIEIEDDKPRTASGYSELCDDAIRYYPDESEVRDLLRKLRLLLG